MLGNLLECHVHVNTHLLNSIVSLEDHFGTFPGRSLSALVNLTCCTFCVLQIHMNVIDGIGAKTQQRPLL